MWWKKIHTKTWGGSVWLRLVAYYWSTPAAVRAERSLAWASDPSGASPVDFVFKVQHRSCLQRISPQPLYPTLAKCSVQEGNGLWLRPEHGPESSPSDPVTPVHIRTTETVGLGPRKFYCGASGCSHLSHRAAACRDHSGLLWGVREAVAPSFLSLSACCRLDQGMSPGVGILHSPGLTQHVHGVY